MWKLFKLMKSAMCTAVLIAQWFIGNPENSMNIGVIVWRNTMAGLNCEILWTLVMARKNNRN